MYAEERRQAMADLVTQRGRLSVNELADVYAITTETVRRDLSLLERAGIIRRVHGGAVPAEALTALETAVSDRDQAHADEKDRIARAMVEPASSAFSGPQLVRQALSTARSQPESGNIITS